MFFNEITEVNNIDNKKHTAKIRQTILHICQNLISTRALDEFLNNWVISRFDITYIGLVMWYGIIDLCPLTKEIHLEILSLK